MGDGAEFDAIRRLLDIWGSNASGIGDDAAIVDVPSGERLVVSTDASVENVHFRREWLTAEEIGGRAAAAALSDLAAMAATPRGLLLALALPDDWRTELDALARGVGNVASTARCPIIGGNITLASELSLTLTVLGSAVVPLERRGAIIGDDIYVTGRLGGPGAALKSWLGGATPSPEHRARFASPAPRLREARWLASLGAHASIDISDGLLGDAAHLARASHVSIVLDERAIPCVDGVMLDDACVSGEEYELLVAMPHDASIDTDAFEREFGLPITRVGSVVSSAQGTVRFVGGLVPTSRGHDHLK
ncbi:MAG: thiamine-monophosphate kinase [Gemmatimonadetes bacterium]|nr:thiamine-monophosphate kinase [Gemmatimonadota bacterium]